MDDPSHIDAALREVALAARNAVCFAVSDALPAPAAADKEDEPHTEQSNDAAEGIRMSYQRGQEREETCSTFRVAASIGVVMPIAKAFVIESMP